MPTVAEDDTTVFVLRLLDNASHTIRKLPIRKAR